MKQIAVVGNKHKIQHKNKTKVKYGQESRTIFLKYTLLDLLL